MSPDWWASLSEFLVVGQWWGQERAFLLGSQGTLRLLVQGPHFENYCPSFSQKWSGSGNSVAIGPFVQLFLY